MANAVTERGGFPSQAEIKDFVQLPQRGSQERKFYGPVHKKSNFANLSANA